MSLLTPVRCVTSPERFSSSWLWLLHVVLGSCRRCLQRSLLPVRICSFRISRSFMRSLSPPCVLYLVFLGCGLCGTLWVLFLTSSFCALCALCKFTYLVLHLFLVLVLFLSLLAILLVLCLRMRSVSSFVTLFPRLPLPLSRLFLCLISSSVSSLPSASSTSASGSSRVAASLAFARNAPLSSVLEAATWSSSTVFTSFYLKDVQFSSAQGFSLGPVVAAGSVV